MFARVLRVLFATLFYGPGETVAQQLQLQKRGHLQQGLGVVLIRRTWDQSYPQMAVIALSHQKDQNGAKSEGRLKRTAVSFGSATFMCGSR